jgi:hypothetical protein
LLILKTESFEKVMEEMFVVLCLCDIAKHDFAYFFRVYILNVDNKEGHEKLAGLDDELGRVVVVRDAEGFEVKKRVEGVVYEHASVIDLYFVDLGRV